MIIPYPPTLAWPHSTTYALQVWRWIANAIQKKTIINNFSTSQPYRRVGERLFKWQENGMIPTIKFSFMLLLLLPAVRNLSKQSCEFQKSWMKINSIYTNRMPYCCTTLLNGGAKISFFHLIIHLQTFKDGIPSLSKPWCKSYSRS